uniref:PPM-type phosphatase domain-containing protein n=1 Tax=Daucus carota subsp. sativus TaxID=79200 RepID=A0A166IJ98_DAUCS
MTVEMQKWLVEVMLDWPMKMIGNIKIGMSHMDSIWYGERWVTGWKILLSLITGRNGKAKGITIDHEPLKEKKQVENRGGFVVKLPGNVPRVDGQLAMTRAFGDKKVKKHITAKPDVIIKKIDKDINFLILASDGLWKVMSNQEACDCICNITNAQEASEQLIKEALLRESRDDISCIVVMFDG